MDIVELMVEEIDGGGRELRFALAAAALGHGSWGFGERRSWRRWRRLYRWLGKRLGVRARHEMLTALGLGSSLALVRSGGRG